MTDPPKMLLVPAASLGRWFKGKAMGQYGGMLMGVMFGALVLVGCSREPAQEPGTAMATQQLSELGKDLSQVAGDGAP